jgi:hypothetical protein
VQSRLSSTGVSSSVVAETSAHVGASFASSTAAVGCVPANAFAASFDGSWFSQPAVRNAKVPDEQLAVAVNRTSTKSPLESSLPPLRRMKLSDTDAAKATVPLPDVTGFGDAESARLEKQNGTAIDPYSNAFALVFVMRRRYSWLLPGAAEGLISAPVVRSLKVAV